MKVSKSIETPGGAVQFEGELSSDELDVIIGVGLNYLLQQGALPFKVLPSKESSRMVEVSTEEQ